MKYITEIYGLRVKDFDGSFEKTVDRKNSGLSL